MGRCIVKFEIQSVVELINVEGSMKRKISALFSELCCSDCKSDFDENSVRVMREEKTKGEEMLVVRIVCSNCGKSFGVAFLGISDLEFKDYADEDLTLHVQEGPKPISVDDVLDAHQFIKTLDKNWQKFIANIVED